MNLPFGTYAVLCILYNNEFHKYLHETDSIDHVSIFNKGNHHHHHTNHFQRIYTNHYGGINIVFIQKKT